MKVAIIGFGLEGQAAYDHWHEGNEITICDQNESVQVPEGASAQLGDDYLKDLDRFDIIVRSPIIHPWVLIAASSPEILHKVTSNTNEFFKVSPSRNIVGVTGTKGKGTTSTLISKMLEACGYAVHFGGNVGVPALELLKQNIQPDHWVILELSSYQLIDLKYGPHVAVCLMITAEHLDWHMDMDEYVGAKQHLFGQQNPEDLAIYYSANPISTKIASSSQGRKIPYFEPPGAFVDNGRIMIDGQEVCRVEELKLLGQHNWQNICAAVTAVWQINPNLQAIREVVVNFTGLEHRLEFVREFNGVTYYDDSFGTTPETASVALQAFTAPKVIILGGSDKGASYDDLAKTVAESNVRKVLLIGDQASNIQAALERVGFSNFCEGGQNMSEIIARAREAAQPGDIVLLSPACASFGMFANYKDRGNQFKQAVQALA